MLLHASPPATRPAAAPRPHAASRGVRQPKAGSLSRAAVVRPAAAPAFAAPPTPADAASSSSSSAASPPGLVVRLALEDEYEAVAALRAEAYYEDQPGGGGRFAASYKKQFRDQEARSLRARTAPRPGGGPPECACLVAAEDGAPSSSILGALDVRPPAAAGGPHPRGVPAGDASASAVLNVAVSPDARRKGVGASLMAAAARHAAAEWGASRLYASVAASNGPARALYAACGYKAVEGEPGAECDVAGGVAGAATLGKELLLCAEV